MVAVVVHPFLLLLLPKTEHDHEAFSFFCLLVCCRPSHDCFCSRMMREGFSCAGRWVGDGQRSRLFHILATERSRFIAVVQVVLTTSWSCCDRHSTFYASNFVFSNSIKRVDLLVHSTMPRLRFRRRKPEQPEVMSSGGMASIKNEEILRVVRDIRRRNGLPDLVTKSSRRSRSTTTSSSKSSKEKTQLREEVQLPEHTQPPDEQAQLPVVQIFKPVVVHATVTQSDTKNVSLPISYGRKSSKSPNHDEKRTPNAAVHRSVSPPLLRLKKNRKAPPAVNTSLECSTSGYDSPTRCISSNDTSARSSAFSSRTPKSIQRFSFLCSEVFPCNHTEEEDATIDNTSSSNSGTDDDRSWKSNSKKRQALAKRPPSFFREVYDQVIEELGGGIEEEDTILAASPRKCEGASYSESCDSPDNGSSPMSAAPGKRRTRHARTIHSIMKVLDNSTDLSSESTNDRNETDEDDEDEDITSLDQSILDGLISVPSRVYAYQQTLSSTSNL